MEENKNNEEIVPKKIIVDNNEVNSLNKLNDNKKAGLIATLVLIITILVVVLVYVLFFSNMGEEKENDSKGTISPTMTPTITPELIPTPTASSEIKIEEENELIVYKTSDGDLCVYDYCAQKKYGEQEAFRIKVSSKDAKLVASDYDNTYILFNDNGIKIYDVKNKSINNSNLNGEYKEYTIYKSEDKKKIIGIGFKDNNDYVGYYNVSLGKSLYYDKKYKNDDSPFIFQINDNYLSLTTDDGAYLLNANTEKIELSHRFSENESDLYGYWGRMIGNKYIYSFGFCPDVCIIHKMYNQNLKEFFSGEVDEEYISIKDNNIYLIDNQTIKKYNNNGELINTIDKYHNIQGIISNYVVYVENNYLKIENIEDSSDNKELMEWKDDYFIDNLMSQYYSRKDLDELNEKNKKEGLYIVVYYSGGSETDANGNYGMEYCYTLDKEVIEYPIKTEMGGRAKPVLYLYPEKETNVTVKFSKPELLTTTYPKYINSWNVTVKPNGDMIDKNGKYYYALYWDEKRYNEALFHEGFYVEGKNAIKFLEEKLSIIGLSDKERNEFIMYWLPIMENNKKNLVYFELTKERELSNKLIITPKPDSLLRVNIHIKKVNEKVNIKEQKLETFKRVGFTAVEWGGMTY